jgi:hypothetical protein
MVTLLASPPELISRICRFIGLTVNGRVRYTDKGLRNLRLTCRELCEKTTFDAAVRYDMCLEEIDVWTSHRGLCKLLHLTQVPAFRERIGHIRLCAPNGPYRYDYDSYAFPKWVRDAKRHTKIEAIETYRESGEAVLLLAACLHNLKNAASFTMLEVGEEDDYRLALSALELCKFPRPIATLDIESEYIQGYQSRALSTDTTDIASYLKGVKVVAPTLAEHGIQFRVYVGTEEKIQRHQRLVRAARDSNEVKFHFQNYTPRRLKLPEIIGNTSGIEHLELDGCCERDKHPLRFCNGCQDVFARRVATTYYTHLTSFCVRAMYISGGRLRRSSSNIQPH